MFYEKAWGKWWPRQQRTIYKTDIYNNESNPADEPADGSLADKLVIPNEFSYEFLSGMREVKEFLGAAAEHDDILVI